MPEVGIEVEVYYHAAPTVKVDVLNGAISPSALEELKGPGGGDITLSLYDPKLRENPELIAYRNVLKVKVAGRVVGALVVGKNSSQIIDSSADGKVYQISGEGVRTWFNDANVYPDGGIKKTSFNSRAFNFSSPQGAWYVPAQWVTPYNVASWGDVPSSPWRYAPSEWPDVPLAKWVWSSNSIASAPLGDNFFRYEFDVAAAVTYSLFLAVDNQYSVYIDGQLVSQSDPATNGWSATERIDAILEVGHHIIGIRATNVGGPAALIAALFYYGDPAVPSSAVLVSYTGKSGDTAWKVAGYPNPVPGFSPGEIVLQLLSEASARGVRFPSWLTPTFTASADSYGVAWDRSLDWSFDVGASLASVIEQLEELVCDVWVNPDTFALNMAKERGVDRSIMRYGVDGITPTGFPVIFEEGNNLGASSVDGVSQLVNALLISSADGWLKQDDTSGSIATYGRIEGKLETGASSAVSAAVANAVFLQKANPELGASYEIIPQPGSVPFLDFNAGDWVIAPNYLGLGVKRRVMSISVEVDEAGNPNYSVEFDTIFQDNDDKLNVWLKKLGGGSLGGQFANSGSGSSSPIGTPVVTPPRPPVVKIPAQAVGLGVTSLGLWSANGVEAFSEATLTWDPVTSNTDGTATVPTLYEVWGHLTANSDNTYQRFAVTTGNISSIRPFQTGTQWTFQVRALNSLEAAGAYSSSVNHTMSSPNVPMDAPDSPTLTSSKGVLAVAWNGLLTGVPPPSRFRYVYATISTTSGGTYTRTGTTLSRDGRTILVSGLTVGSTYWVKLVAVDGVGILSAASSAVSAVVTGIDLGDLDTSIGTAIGAAKQAGILARSMDNMLNDNSFEQNDPAMWSLETGDVTNVTTTPFAGLRALRVKASTAAYVASKHGVVLSVVPGETYQYAGWYRADGAGSSVDNAVTLSVDYGASASALSSSVVMANSDVVGSTYLYMSGTWVVPVGVNAARPTITVAETGNINVYLVDNLTFRMVIPNALIVDGAITATKIGAGEVIAGKLSADSVAAANIQAGAITAGKVAAGAITANEIAANAITANKIAAGSITALKIAADVGQSLDISSNASVNILSGQISTAVSSQNATAGSLQTMQTYYQFGPSGAIISSPGSPFAIRIASDRIEMLELSVPVSYWNAGQMFVRSFVGEEVVLGNHKIEKYGTGTVVRTL